MSSTPLPHTRFSNTPPIWYWYLSFILLAMTPEIRFTPFGIPYVVEFANVAFRKRSKTSISSVAPTAGASCSTITLGHASTTQPSVSTVSLVNPPEARGEGLWIQLNSQQTYPYRRLSETRVARLKHRIANAVVAAGMNAPATAKVTTPERCVSHGRIHTSDLRRAHAPPAPSSLYHGTYGQVMSAFRAAGLSTTPCDQSGFEDG